MDIVTFFIVLAVFSLTMCVGGILLSHYQRRAAKVDPSAAVKYSKILISLVIAYVLIIFLSFAVYASGEQARYSFHYLTGQGLTYMNLCTVLMFESILFGLIRLIITYIGLSKENSRFADIEKRKRLFRKLLHIFNAVLIVTIVIFLFLKYVI